MVTKICKNCGKEFTVIDSRKEAMYCCKKCRGEYESQFAKETRICKHCGKEFIVNKSSSKKYCSAKCGFDHRNTKVTKICQYCGKEFSVVKKRENSALYCCRECADKARRAKPNTVCTQCGKPFYMKPSHQAKHIHGNFCSRDCLNLWKQEAYSGSGNHQYGLKGPLNASFKGFEIQQKNIKQYDDLIYMPNHPRANANGRVRKYIYLVEKYHHLFDEHYFYFDGEEYHLKKGIVIHHIDQNHNNNDISNLMPLTISEHTKIHAKLGTFNHVKRDDKCRFIKQTAVYKQGELLETPEVDNQQPSLNSNILEGSTTNDRVLTGNTEDSNINTSALHHEINDEDIV